METLRSPITGSGGGLPGTGRAPAILPAPAQDPTSEGSPPPSSFEEVAGELFPSPDGSPHPDAPAPVGALSVPQAEASPAPVELPEGLEGAPLPFAPVTPGSAPLRSGGPTLPTGTEASAAAPVEAGPPAPELAPPANSLTAVPAPVVDDAGPEIPLPEAGAAAPNTPEAGPPEVLPLSENTPRGAAEAATATPGQAVASADEAAVEKAAEVLRQIQAEIRPGARRIRVDLDPPELGRLVIRAALVEGRVTAVVEAESAATLELLERQAPELLAALREAGVDARSVSLELSSNHSRGQGSGQGTDTEHRPSQPAQDAEQDEPATRRDHRTPTTDAGDGVDTYA